LKLEKKADINITVAKCDITVCLEKMAEIIGFKFAYQQLDEGTQRRGWGGVKRESKLRTTNFSCISGLSKGLNLQNVLG
jgi:hypothetical protein